MIFCVGIGVLMWCEPPPKPTAVICPPLIEWKAKDQSAAADYLATLPAGHPLRTMSVVLVRQRNVVRACKQ